MPDARSCGRRRAAIFGKIPSVRIVHLTATFPPYLGGAGTIVWHLSGEQARRGEDVEVLTARLGDDEPAAGNGATVRRAKPWLRIGNAPLIPAAARLRDYDVIHLHYPFLFGTELLLASGAHRRAALVVSYHNRLVGEGVRRPLFATYEASVGRLMARAADRICVLSPEHAESIGYLRAVQQRTPERLVELPGGVDVEHFSPGAGDPAVRARLEIPADVPLAVFVATLDHAHRFKRVDQAIEALAQGPEALHLLVAGDGPLRAEYEQLAGSLGVAERVHFAGAVDHEGLPALLRASDLLVLASQPPESFGMVLIEAMACGLPVVASRYPGAGAVVDDGVTGLLVPVGDVPALAQALQRLTSMSPAEREEMGNAGRARCLERFSWPGITDRLETIYREAVENGSL